MSGIGLIVSTERPESLDYGGIVHQLLQSEQANKRSFVDLRSALLVIFRAGAQNLLGRFRVIPGIGFLSFFLIFCPHY